MPFDEPLVSVYRAFLIVDASEKDAANDLAVEIGTGGEAERASFLVPCVSGPGSTATHYGCSGGVTEAMRVRFRAALDTGRLTTCRFYLWSESSGALVNTNSPSAFVRIGSAWDVAESMMDAGIRILVVG